MLTQHTSTTSPKMTTQTVFRLTSKIGLEGIQASQEPIPTADKYEVLIKVRSVSLNYRDIAIANDTYPLPTQDNVIPCSDMAGEVIQIGNLVKGFAVGDGVLTPINPTLLYGLLKDSTGDAGSDTFGGPTDGFLREYIAVPAHAVIKLPKSSRSFTQWACLPTTGSTAWNSFYGNTPLKPGDTVLLLGTTPMKTA